MKKAELKKEGFYIRKRDKTFVHVEKFGALTVTYVTHLMLMQWSTSVDSFLRSFRPATEEEIKHAAPDKSTLPSGRTR